MPTYDYECSACGHTFEEFQSINAEVLTKCPECKKKKLQRLFGTGAAIVFKGSGFYQTDYRSEGYKKAAKADSKASESKSGDSKSNDSKSSDTKSSASGSNENKSSGAKSDGSKSSGGSSSSGDSSSSKPKKK